MKATDAEKLRDPAALQGLARSGIADGSSTGTGLGHGDHEAELVSIREVNHGEHKIVIKTTYEVSVDGVPLATHLHVLNDGSLHSHALPNYMFLSAVDLVKKIIDLFPDDFTSIQSGHGHGGHSHQHS